MTTTFGDLLDETLPLVGFIPVAGPPAVLPMRAPVARGGAA
jgi:hypothetical protein